MIHQGEHKVFIVLMTYKKPLEIVDQYLLAHRAYLEEGYKKNYLLASGPRIPRIGGIVLSHLKNRAELMAFLAQDPFVLQEIASYEIIEFEAVKFQEVLASFV